MNAKPTEVCLTVDTEFSIGGNFDNPELPPVAEPMVLGKIDGKEHGLGCLLGLLSEFGVRATFFVEALQTAYFGDELMGTIARRIADAGHDVQLHLHPCWPHYEAAPTQAPREAPNDSCAGRSDAELDHFFEFGLSVFSRWGLPRPVAVRSGNFQVDINFYRAAARSGICVSRWQLIAPPMKRSPDRAADTELGSCRNFRCSLTPMPSVPISDPDRWRSRRALAPKSFRSYGKLIIMEFRR